MTWNAVESAIEAWVRSGSGLSTGRVIFTAQGGPRPETPYISITLTPGAVIGQGWLETEHDEDGDPGEDLVRTSRGLRYLDIRLQCYAAEPTGAASAAAILDSVRGSLEKLSIREPLREVGVAIHDVDKIKRIDGVLNSTVFEPRAVLEVRASVPSEVVDLGTFVETVEATNEITGEDLTIP